MLPLMDFFCFWVVLCLVGELSSFVLQAWGAARRVSKDDWLEWLRRLSLELLKDSSSPSLRSCWALAQAYNPMARYSIPGLLSHLKWQMEARYYKEKKKVV